MTVRQTSKGIQSCMTFMFAVVLAVAVGAVGASVATGRHRGNV